jgi:hypothetical protein
MSSKTIQYKGQPKQIFECYQANGECLNDKGYPNSVWPKGGSKSSAPTRSAPKSGNGNDDRSNRIERQHSQEMALRYLVMQGGLPKDSVHAAKLREMIDWFQRDIGRLPGKPVDTENIADDERESDEPPF